MLRKPLYEEGYIIYSKADDSAIEIMDRKKEYFTWTNKPACYKVYKTEAEARKDIEYAKESLVESLRYLRHAFKEDELPVINAKLIVNRLAGVDVYKVQKSIIVDIEGV